MAGETITESGRLDRIITIQQNTPTIAGSGERQPSWSALHTGVPAARMEYIGDEQVQADSLRVGQRRAVFRIRWLSGITSGMRIVDDDGEAWDIVSPPLERGRRDKLDLPAIQRAPER